MRTKLLIFLFIINLIALYAGHFDNSFHFDDSHTIENNSFITSLKNVPDFFSNPSTFSTVPSNQSYRPLLTTTFAIDYALSKYFFNNGLDPFFYHLTSFSAFILQLILMYLLFVNLLNNSFDDDRSKILASIAVVYYGFHGAIPDTVNYVSSRSDIFSTLAVVSALLMYLNKTLRKYQLYLIPAVLGMFSKEQAGVLAGIIFFYLFIFEEKIANFFNFKEIVQVFIRCILKSLPSLVICSAIFIMGVKLSKTWTPGGYDRMAYLMTQSYVVMDYFKMFFYPEGLSADTDWELVRSNSDPRLWKGLLFLVISIIIILKTMFNKNLRFVSFGLIWFFLSLIPSSSIIPLAEVKNDHRLYFPYVGLSLATVVFLNFIYESKYLKNFKTQSKFGAFIACFVFALFLNIKVAIARIGVWDTEERLWKDVTIVSPKNGRGLMNYGLTQMAKGNYREAEKQFLAALERTPTYALLNINLGVLYQNTGRIELAQKNYERAIQLSPNDPTVLFFYGVFLSRQNRCNEAVEHLERSALLSPGRKETYPILINCLKVVNRETDANKWQVESEKLN